MPSRGLTKSHDQSGTDVKRESKESMLSALLDDDDDLIKSIYMIIVITSVIMRIELLVAISWYNH